MVAIYPSVVFLIPLIISVFTNRKWIPPIFILTVPFFSLVVFEAVGHPFTLPEIAVIFLIFNIVDYHVGGDSTVTIHNAALLFASTFILLGIVSAITLFLFPTNQTTHAYNSAYLFLDKKTSPLTYSSSNLTQSLLRIFSFGSILIIYLSFSKKNLVKYIRLLVFEGLIIGTTGMLYQFFLFFEIPFIRQLRWFGFVKMRELPSFFGPLPQLMSVPGEPGYTALYFLFLLGIMTPVMISNYERIFSRSESMIFTILFILFIFLTGSGTGFGGIMILGIVTGFYYLFIEYSLPSLKKIIKTGLIVLAPSVTLAVLVIHNLRRTTYGVVSELAFQGGSGSIRAYWLKFALDLFQNRPLLGYGFGSYYGLSVFGTILVSTGIIGLCLFLGFHALIVRDLIRNHRSNSVLVVNSALSHVLAISIATIFGTMLLAKSITATLFPWYWLAVGFGLAVITDD
jgi:hypothetical protein